MTNRRADYIQFLGKNYMSNTNGRTEIGGVQLQDTNFEQHLAQFGLEWFSYDFNRVYSGDVIGMKITEDDNDQEGLPLDQLPQLFAQAKERLLKAGITEEPKLFASFHHSY